MTEQIKKFISEHFGFNENIIDREDLISLARTLKEADRQPRITFTSQVPCEEQDHHLESKAG